MIMEALKFLFDQANDKAAVVNKQQTPKQVAFYPTDGRSLAYEQNGEIKFFAVPAPLRDHNVASVADLIEAAKRWDTDPVVWIGDGKITLVIDDKDRRELVSLSLYMTGLFDLLSNYSSPSMGRVSQQQLVGLLRRELRDAAGAAEMLAAVKSIKFRTQEQGDSTINHGNESMGLSIEREVTGAAEIPDTLVVRTPVHNNPGELEFSYPIAIDVEIDVQAKLFVLRTVADDVDRVVNQAMNDIRTRIVDGLPGVPVLFGSV